MSVQGLLHLTHSVIRTHVPHTRTHSYMPHAHTHASRVQTCHTHTRALHMCARLTCASHVGTHTQAVTFPCALTCLACTHTEHMPCTRVHACLTHAHTHTLPAAQEHRTILITQRRKQMNVWKPRHKHWQLYRRPGGVSRSDGKCGRVPCLGLQRATYPGVCIWPLRLGLRPRCQQELLWAPSWMESTESTPGRAISSPQTDLATSTGTAN